MANRTCGKTPAAFAAPLTEQLPASASLPLPLPLPLPRCWPRSCVGLVRFPSFNEHVSVSSVGVWQAGGTDTRPVI